MSWNPTLHPRVPGGPGGGEFMRRQAGWMNRLEQEITDTRGGDRYRRGRDIRDELDRDELRAKAYQPGTGQHPNDDPQLAAIYAAQGFDGKPEVVSSDELDARIADGWRELWRGVQGNHDGTSDHYSVAGDYRPPSGAYAEAFRTGDYWAGQGVRGNGTYTGASMALAQEYTAREGPWFGPQTEEYFTPGSAWPGLIRMALRPDARTITWNELDAMITKHLDNDGYPITGDPLADEGRMAAAMGYDAILVHRTGAGASDIRTVIVLNRTAVAVQEAWQ